MIYVKRSHNFILMSTIYIEIFLVRHSFVKKRHRLGGNKIVYPFSHLSRISKALFC
uniref:Uncharacterized protein n=1 Tax=Heterorhabditis bacteriophora TaxID=37862 RepID=A0A1I7WCL1_HETBA